MSASSASADRKLVPAQSVQDAAADLPHRLAETQEIRLGVDPEVGRSRERLAFRDGSEQDRFDRLLEGVERQGFIAPACPAQPIGELGRQSLHFAELGTRGAVGVEMGHRRLGRAGAIDALAGSRSSRRSRWRKWASIARSTATGHAGDAGATELVGRG